MLTDAVNEELSNDQNHKKTAIKKLKHVYCKRKNKHVAYNSK